MRRPVVAFCLSMILSENRYPLFGIILYGAAASFSRRRCTEEGMRIASRYLATVRRAMSMPASRNLSTMVSSESTLAAASASINWRMRWRTASAECASPPSADAIDEVKKYFSSKMPRLVAIYLLAVTRETVDKYMATSRGIFELKYFFTSSIASADGGEAHSAEAVRHRIRQLIDAEPAADVLSDDTIVDKLREAGIDIARRTVAKYREAMRIPSSVQRRREKLAAAP